MNNNIKTYHGGKSCESVGKAELPMDRNQWLAFITTVMKI
jgi:hypothetical protein